MENTLIPSELHLKKDLAALKHAPFLCDPELHASWSSPLSSKSLAAFFTLSHRTGSRGSPRTLNESGESYVISPRNEKRKKEVYLHNWGHPSGKLSESGNILGKENRQRSVSSSPRNSSLKHRKSDHGSHTNIGDPLPLYRVRDSSSEVSLRRALRRSRDGTSKRTSRNSTMSKMAVLPSTSRGMINSFDQPMDAFYCDAEHAHCKAQEPPPKSGSSLRSSSHSCAPTPNNSRESFEGKYNSDSCAREGTSASTDENDVSHLRISARGCGIPFSWSRNVRERGCTGFYAASLPDTLRRKRGIALCGSQSWCGSSICSPTPSRASPLSTCGSNEDGFCGNISDEMSSIYELDLEAVSRLDEKTWLSCRTQVGSYHLEMRDSKSLSERHRPMSFADIVGQNLVVESLRNSISMGRIAPVYLFHGPRGTGKTLTARIFAAALNCMSNEGNKPCGLCKECTEFANGSGSNVRHVDGTNKKAIERVRLLLKKMSMAKEFSRYKVIIINECHILSSETWSDFMEFLKESPSQIAIIFTTSDPDSMPQSILSLCQKHHFSKLKDADIVLRLKRLSSAKNLNVDSDALDLIALNSDGSLREAEMMLEQLSLRGGRITVSLVNDLVGVVSEDKLIDLLEIAMSSDTAETVKRSRELMNAGVDPLAITSKLAALIMDMMTGTRHLANSQYNVTEHELDKLHHALKILSDAEKRLRLLSGRSRWFTAALLQLGSYLNPERAHSIGASSKQSIKTTKESMQCNVKQGLSCRESSTHFLALQESSSESVSRSKPSSPHESIDKVVVDATHNHNDKEQLVFTSADPVKLEEIWRRCIARCHSRTLRQLLSVHGKLVSITEAEGSALAYIAFSDDVLKSKAERFLSSITNSVQVVLGHNVKVKIGYLPEYYLKPPTSDSDSQTSEHMSIDKSLNMEKDSTIGKQRGDLNLPWRSENNSAGMPSTMKKGHRTLVTDEDLQKANADTETSSSKKGATEDADLEQKLESNAGAWLQAARKSTEEPAFYLKTHNQLCPHNNVNSEFQREFSMPKSISSKLWEEDLTNEIEEVKDNDTRSRQRERVGVVDDFYPMSPSFLHSYNLSNFDGEKQRHDSCSGCNGLFCWKAKKARRRKAKQQTLVRSPKPGCLACFNRCWKLKANA